MLLQYQRERDPSEKKSDSDRLRELTTRTNHFHSLAPAFRVRALGILASTKRGKRVVSAVALCRARLAPTVTGSLLSASSSKVERHGEGTSGERAREWEAQQTSQGFRTATPPALEPTRSAPSSSSPSPSSWPAYWTASSLPARQQTRTACPTPSSVSPMADPSPGPLRGTGPTCPWKSMSTTRTRSTAWGSWCVAGMARYPPMPASKASGALR